MAPQPSSIRVEPDDKIFHELGHTNYEDIDILAELIDNSISAKVKGVKLKIEIDIGVSENSPERSYLSVLDNASGIDINDLGTAIAPAATSGQADPGLNEHGLGMKQAIAAAGTLNALKTKSQSMSQAAVVRRFGFGEIPIEWEDVIWDHGTEIRIIELKPDLRHGRRVYSERVRAYLGARYRRLLDPESPKIEIRVTYHDLDSAEKHEFWIEQVRPIYFHPNRRQNRPVILKKEFSGIGWKARLTFGYMPENEAEYEELNIKSPKQYEPYSKSLKKQGIDIIMHDRVIQFHQLHEIGIVKGPHNQYNNIRGELELLQGFSTAATKNRMMRSAHWVQLLAEVKSFLDQEELLKGRHVPSEIPEVVLRDRLKELLEKTPYKRQDVKTEVVIEGLEGRIDVVADGEPWELKKGQAGGLDVYQLFAYLEFGNFKQGSLVADNFTNGARAAAKLIKEKHDMTIELVPRENLAINHPLTRSEIDHYL